ncbi:hypothetical protein FRC02_008373 [Tulasnella sp. 418]|nr:hypothetical protein FRC02_008373 [Tulasnella sp. 418]
MEEETRHIGKASTVAGHAAPGQKVGLIAARAQNRFVVQFRQDQGDIDMVLLYLVPDFLSTPHLCCINADKLWSSQEKEGCTIAKFGLY